MESYNFEILSPEYTGIDFSNDLEMTPEMNIFKYLYFYNGAGVGLGDFNKDGLIDIYLVGNMVPDRLYLNRGDFTFEDISEQAGIAHHPNTWATGVSIVDINQDGLLDIYVSHVSDFRTFEGHNILYLCEGIDENGLPSYREASEEYDLDLVGFGTQAIFLDYDNDGDLDMMQLNHSVHANGTFGQRKIFRDSLHPTAGDRFFRNDAGTFTEITREVGIYFNAIGYGLGIVASDVNMDGYTDLYVGNDFHENDYLYINQNDGTFRESLTEQIMHTSRFSMGVDAADINNDGWPDIMSLDMLPYDPEILKKSEGEDALATFNFKLGYGYNHQYAKNCLQINNGNNTFSEIAQYAGVFATDWSWSVLLMDFDNDGHKDIFVSNGIPKRMNDIDYINFVSDDDMRWKIRNTELDYEDLDLVKSIPEIKLPNKLFKNVGELRFEDMASKIKNDQISYSNGAAYADLNNDGKLDIVVNNINGPAFIYKNITSTDSTHKMASLELGGDKGNLNALGSKLMVYKQAGEILLFEKFPVRGFQSSMETPLYAGLGNVNEIDSIFIIWPDGHKQSIDKTKLSFQGKVDTIFKQESDLQFNYIAFREDKRPYRTILDITESSGIHFHHKENPFIEFNRERLIPHSTSADGPALAVGDLNGDGLDDFFIGASKRNIAAIFFQNPDGTFQEQFSPGIAADSIFEDVEAIIIDVNGDGFNDLIVGSGGNEYYNNDPFQLSRVYLNDGLGNLSRKEDALEDIFPTTGAMLSADFNDDGYPDLFIGARAQPWAYGQIPRSYLLINDGTGKFRDATDDFCAGLKYPGMIKTAIYEDWDGDGIKELIIGVEWGGIYAFQLNGSNCNKKEITPAKGWWNELVLFKVSPDSKNLLFAGNLGENTRLKASEKEPVKMYYADFDDNGTKEQILTYFVQGQEITFANMADLFSQLPNLKKKYLFARDFAKASLIDLFGKEKLNKADVFRANYFKNAIISSEDGLAKLSALPKRGQWTPFHAAIPIDINKNGKNELLLYGNFYGNNVQLGRYDADFGSIVFFEKNTPVRVERVKGQAISGEVRRIRPIKIAGKENQTTYLLARNDLPLKLISIQ